MEAGCSIASASAGLWPPEPKVTRQPGAFTAAWVLLSWASPRTQFREDLIQNNEWTRTGYIQSRRSVSMILSICPSSTASLLTGHGIMRIKHFYFIEGFMVIIKSKSNNNNYNNESAMLIGLRVVDNEVEWPLSSVFQANSCVILSGAWENIPAAGGWRDLTPEPLVKKTCVLPDSIMMLMSTSTLLNLMLTFFPFSCRKVVFFSSFLFFLG